MFGFSLQKILLLMAILGAVWYGFKMVARLQERQLERTAKKAPSKSKTKRDQAAQAKAMDAEEMVRCPVCDAYVAARVSTDCGRGDCPY